MTIKMKRRRRRRKERERDTDLDDTRWVTSKVQPDLLRIRSLRSH